MANDLRMTVKMAQNGRESGQNHTMVYRVGPVGNAYTVAGAKQLGFDFASAFAGVAFANTSFLRVRFAEIDNKGTSIPLTGFGRPLTLVGRNAFAVGDGPSSPQVVLNIEKSADGGDPALTAFRHCLSANEYAEYVVESVIPARFTVAPVGAYGAGDSLSDNMKKALADNGFQLKLPPLWINGAWVQRVITEIETQDFRNLTNTKTRIPAYQKLVQAVQQQLNEIKRRFFKLWNKYAGINIPQAILQALLDLVALALQKFLSLPVDQRPWVNYPAFPALPAG